MTVKLPGIEKQIAEVLADTVTGEAVQYNYLISGEQGSGKTELAKNLAKYLYKTGCILTPKVALIKAEKLNHINLIQKKETLADCCMIVEGAGRLESSTAADLSRLIQAFNGRIAVILEDTKENMNQLIRKEEELIRLFKPQIQMPACTPEHLADAVCELLKKEDYELLAGAREKLLEVIQERIGETENPSMQLAADIARMAAENARRRSQQILLNFAESGKFGVADLEGIVAEDFVEAEKVSGGNLE